MANETSAPVNKTTDAKRQNQPTRRSHGDVHMGRFGRTSSDGFAKSCTIPSLLPASRSAGYSLSDEWIVDALQHKPFRRSAAQLRRWKLQSQALGMLTVASATE